MQCWVVVHYNILSFHCSQVSYQSIKVGKERQVCKLDLICKVITTLMLSLLIHKGFCHRQLNIIIMVIRLKRKGCPGVCLALWLDETEMDWLAGERRWRGELPGMIGGVVPKNRVTRIGCKEQCYEIRKLLPLLSEKRINVDHWPLPWVLTAATFIS